MGSGIGGALGLAIGNPDSPVVCICGDGGMQMMGMEILVAKKLNLPVVYAIFNDGRYNMVFHGFKTLYGYAHEWDTPPTDFTAWAASMGVKGFTIRQPGELQSEIIVNSIQQSQPIVLDIHINKDIRISGAGRNEHLQHMSVGKTLLTEVG
jgi:acetolactate synthase-1/2/3 large subunit